MLSQGHIKASNPTPHRCGQRTLYGYLVLSDGLQGIRGKGIIAALDSLLTGNLFLPGDLSPAGIGLCYRGSTPSPAIKGITGWSGTDVTLPSCTDISSPIV
jgi:hypothetical protein